MHNPAIPSDANALLSAYGLRPRKRWGQNFLCDQNVLNRIAGAGALQSGDHVLEIGPGLGGLTRTLASQCESVTAVEIDPLMEPILKETLADYPNVRVIIADFLKLDLGRLIDAMRGITKRPTDLTTEGEVENEEERRTQQAAPQHPTPNTLYPRVKVVANIPYYITTPILERLLEQKGRIDTIVLLVQQEVAERMTAKAGTEGYGSLSVFIQYHAKAEIVAKISKHVFMPPPDVSSVLIRLTPVVPGTVEVRDETTFFKIVRSAFCQRRKTILNAVSTGGIGLDREATQALLARAGIDPIRRGETLSPEEFARLANSVEPE